MAALNRQRSCSELGACQARPDCQECGYPIGECQDVDGMGATCTRVHGMSEGTQSAVRVQRLINQRHQHQVLDPMPMPTGPLHVATHRATPHHPPAPDAQPNEPEELPREHSPAAFLGVWAIYIGLLVLIGLAAARTWLTG